MPPSASQPTVRRFRHPSTSSILSSRSAQWIAGFAGEQAIDAEDLNTGPQVADIDVTDGSLVAFHSFLQDAEGVERRGWIRYFRAHHFRDPVFRVSLLSHLEDDSKNHISLARTVRAHEQEYRQIALPVLPVTEVDFPQFGQSQVAHRIGRVHDNGDIGVGWCSGRPKGNQRESHQATKHEGNPQL